MGYCPGVPDSQTRPKRLSTHAHKNHGAGGGGLRTEPIRNHSELPNTANAQAAELYG